MRERGEDNVTWKGCGNQLSGVNIMKNILERDVLSLQLDGLTRTLQQKHAEGFILEGLPVLARRDCMEMRLPG